MSASNGHRKFRYAGHAGERREQVPDPASASLDEAEPLPALDDGSQGDASQLPVGASGVQGSPDSGGELGGSARNSKV